MPEISLILDFFFFFSLYLIFLGDSKSGQVVLITTGWLLCFFFKYDTVHICRVENFYICCFNESLLLKSPSRCDQTGLKAFWNSAKMLRFLNFVLTPKKNKTKHNVSTNEPQMWPLRPEYYFASASPGTEINSNWTLYRYTCRTSAGIWRASEIKQFWNRIFCLKLHICLSLTNCKTVAVPN